MNLMFGRAEPFQSLLESGTEEISVIKSAFDATSWCPRKPRPEVRKGELFPTTASKIGGKAHRASMSASCQLVPEISSYGATPLCASDRSTRLFILYFL